MNWSGTAFVLGVLALGTVVIVVVVWQVAAVLRAKAIRARDADYRALALTAVEAQEKTATVLAALRARVDSLDEILRQVD